VISRTRYQEEGLGRFLNYSRDSLLLTPDILNDFNEFGVELELSPLRHLVLTCAAEIGDAKSLWDVARFACPSLKSFTIITPPALSSKQPETPRLVEVDPYSEYFNHDEGWKAPKYVADAKKYWEYFKRTVLAEDSSWMSIDFQVAFTLWDKDSS
jgi:hypothetical protein